jgi:hypothetical protein
MFLKPPARQTTDIRRVPAPRNDHRDVVVLLYSFPIDPLPGLDKPVDFVPKGNQAP